MIPYLVLNGLKTSTDRPTFTLRPEDEAMGHIPGWELLVDPDFANDNGALNRVTAKTLAIDSSPNFGTPLGTFSGGETAFTPADGDYVSYNPALAFPQTAWSVVFAARPEVRVSSFNNVITPKSSHSNPEIAPRIGFNPAATSFRVLQNGLNGDATARLSYTPGTDFSTRDTLLMATFSTRDGLRIFENGVEVAADDTDTDVFTAGYGSGQWNILSYGRGKFGMIGILSIDLGWAENKVFRDAITEFYLDKYDITP
jgi:hypothetical protein